MARKSYFNTWNCLRHVVSLDLDVNHSASKWRSLHPHASCFGLERHIAMLICNNVAAVLSTSPPGLDILATLGFTSNDKPAYPPCVFQYSSAWLVRFVLPIVTTDLKVLTQMRSLLFLTQLSKNQNGQTIQNPQQGFLTLQSCVPFCFVHGG